jgi:hypothetical protein
VADSCVGDERCVRRLAQDVAVLRRVGHIGSIRLFVTEDHAVGGIVVGHRAMWPEAPRGGVGARRECRRRGRMVRVRVRDDDLRDALSRFERVDDRVDVRRDVGARIDDCDVTAPDDVGAGAEIGELARVLRDDAPDQGRDLVDPPVLDLEIANERDRGGQTFPSQTFRPRNAMNCVCSSAPAGGSTFSPKSCGERSMASIGFTFSKH